MKGDNYFFVATEPFFLVQYGCHGLVYLGAGWCFCHITSRVEAVKKIKKKVLAVIAGDLS